MREDVCQVEWRRCLSIKPSPWADARHTPRNKKSLPDIKSNSCSSDTQQLNSTAGTRFSLKKWILFLKNALPPCYWRFKKAIMCPWTASVRRLKIWRARACVYNRPLVIFTFFYKILSIQYTGYWRSIHCKKSRIVIRIERTSKE